MALIKCPECGQEISDKALACPHCGMPLRAQDRGTYDVTFRLKKYFALAQRSVKVLVDNTETYKVNGGEDFSVPMTTGHHDLVLSAPLQKLNVSFDLTDDLTIDIKFNRLTGAIVATGRGTKTSAGGVPITFTVGGGIIKNI